VGRQRTAAWRYGRWRRAPPRRYSRRRARWAARCALQAQQRRDGRVVRRLHGTSLASSSGAHGDHSPNRWDTEAAVTVAFRRGAVSGSAHPHRQQQHSWALKCSVLCSRFRSMLTRELAGDASDKTANSREGQQHNPAQHSTPLLSTLPRIWLRCPVFTECAVYCLQQESLNTGCGGHGWPNSPAPPPVSPRRKGKGGAPLMDPGELRLPCRSTSAGGGTPVGSGALVNARRWYLRPT
jgi:hypothetical protein